MKELPPMEELADDSDEGVFMMLLLLGKFLKGDLS